jgi:hypothetical protein
MVIGNDEMSAGSHLFSYKTGCGRSRDLSGELCQANLFVETIVL